MFEKFRRDSWLTGILVGIFLPGLLFALLTGGLALLRSCNPAIPYDIVVPKLLLIALLPNVFVLRHYLVKLKFDKTGRGIVGVTFLWALAFVIIQFTL